MGWYEQESRKGLRKIADMPSQGQFGGMNCNDPFHGPPSMQVLEDGVYEYACPSCKHVQRFIVQHPKF